MDLDDLFSRARDLYLDQFRTFIGCQKQGSTHGSAEVKLLLGEGSELFRQRYCADFVRNDGGAEVVEFAAERVLAFDPIEGQFGTMTLAIEGLRWDCINIFCTGPDLNEHAVRDWFDIWFDPDDQRHEPEEEFSGVIHSLVLSGNDMFVDLGSAPTEALWSLLDLVEASGVTHARLSPEA